MNIAELARVNYSNVENAGFERNAKKADGKDQLMEVCTQFEAIFIKQMLKSMKNTVQESGLINGGMAEDFFEDMLYDSYAEKMAETAHFGISEMMYRQLSRQGPDVLTDISTTL